MRETYQGRPRTLLAPDVESDLITLASLAIKPAETSWGTGYHEHDGARWWKRYDEPGQPFGVLFNAHHHFFVLRPADFGLAVVDVDKQALGGHFERTANIPEGLPDPIAQYQTASGGHHLVYSDDSLKAGELDIQSKLTEDYFVVDLIHGFYCIPWDVRSWIVAAETRDSSFDRPFPRDMLDLQDATGSMTEEEEDG